MASFPGLLDGWKRFASFAHCCLHQRPGARFAAHDLRLTDLEDISFSLVFVGHPNAPLLVGFARRRGFDLLALRRSSGGSWALLYFLWLWHAGNGLARCDRLAHVHWRRQRLSITPIRAGV